MKKINPYKIRSMLFVPAIKKEFVSKILNLKGINKPDAIIFDLEDSVHPNAKNQARENLLKLLKNKEIGQKLRKKYVICIRINQFSSEWFDDDLKMANQLLPDFLMLAKTENHWEIEQVRAKSKVPQLIVAIETLKGLKNVSQIAASLNFYDLFCAGYEDPSADLLIERPDNLNTANPLTKFLMDCIFEARINDLIMVDAPARKFSNEKAMREFESECLFNRNNGLNCKMAIHPNQVAVINHVFDKKIILERARKVLGQFNQLKDGTCVIVNDQDEMMDTPSVRMYKKLLNYWSR